MRERIYAIVKRAEPGDTFSRVYDYFIIIVAFVSVAPLMFKEQTAFLDALDIITVYILFIDYMLRWISADYASGKTGIKPFVKYPFTPMAIIDLISLLPSLGLLGQGFRILRMLRIFIIFHYSEHFQYIGNVFKKEGKTLLSVLFIAVFYIFVSALAVFAYEPETFKNFFGALYWATTALTTVGYGDLAPVSDVGRLISMISSIFGIAIIALPAGIVTAGFVDEIHKGKDRRAEIQKKIEERKAEEAKRKAARKIQKPLKMSANAVRYLVVMITGVAMNLLLNQLAQYCNWPVWLDTTGTAYAAIILEPAAGLIVGLVNNTILAAGEFGPATLVYYAVSAAVALIAGVYLKRGGRIEKKRIAPAILLAIAITAALSTLISFWVNNGGPPTGHWENFFYSQAAAAGAPYALACFLGELVVKTFDTLATAALLVAFYFATPKKARGIGVG